MNIVSAASAFPKHYYTQQVLLAVFKSVWGPVLGNPKMLDQLHAAACVDGRHTALPMEEYYNLADFGKANDFWIETAVDLGEQSIGCALSRAGLEPRDLDALFFVSVTGIASPSVDARLAHRVGAPP